MDLVSWQPAKWRYGQLVICDLITIKADEIISISCEYMHIQWLAHGFIHSYSTWASYISMREGDNCRKLPSTMRDWAEDWILAVIAKNHYDKPLEILFKSIFQTVLEFLNECSRIKNSIILLLEPKAKSLFHPWSFSDILTYGGNINIANSS